jgi:hypothetical protein
MSYERKTTRPNWEYTIKELRAMASLAAISSVHHACVTFNVQSATVNRACALTGIEPRRRPSNMHAKAKALILRAKGKTYAEIGRVVGYNQQSIHLWCRDAGIHVDCRFAS